MKTDCIFRHPAIDGRTVALFSLRATRMLWPVAAALFLVLMIFPTSAFSSSSKVVVVRADGQFGQVATDLKNLVPGSNLTQVTASGNSGGAQPMAISPAYTEGGSSSLIVNTLVPAQVTAMSWWNLTTCQSSQLMPTLTTSPQYGQVSYSYGTGTVTSSPCTGTVVPVTFVNYTWTSHPAPALTDYFGVQANDPDGDLLYWNATPEMFAKSIGDCCDGPNHPGGAGVGDPIDVGTGNVFRKFVDYQSAGQNKLGFIRYYNSFPVPNTYAFTFGALWRNNFDRYLHLVSSTLVVAERPDGKLVNFYNNNGSWIADPDVDYTLTQSKKGWALVDHDDTVETYAASGSEGLLQSIALRNGYTQTLTYHSNLLEYVTDSYGRRLTFTYSSGTPAFLAGVTTPDGTLIAYSPYQGNANGQLGQVSFQTTRHMAQSYYYQDPNAPYAMSSIFVDDCSPYSCMYETWTYDSLYRGLSNQLAGPANGVNISYNSDGTRTVTNAFGVTDTYTFSILEDNTEADPNLSSLDWHYGCGNRNVCL